MDYYLLLLVLNLSLKCCIGKFGDPLVTADYLFDFVCSNKQVADIF